MKKGEFISPFFFAHTKLLEQPLGLCYAIGVLKKKRKRLQSIRNAEGATTPETLRQKDRT